MSTDGNQRHNSFKHKIAMLQNQLGIPADYSVRYKLTLQAECTHLVQQGLPAADRLF